jgi:phage FluMu protein Com
LSWKDVLLNGWFLKVVLIFWLVTAVFVMLLLARIDSIVHHDLYNFGLQFSRDWAEGYWAAMRMIYAFVALPFALSAAYFILEVWLFVKGGKFIIRKPLQLAKPVGKSVKAAEQNYMLISCPKCKRVFSKPMVMLDFSSGKTRLVNVCPHCNHILGEAESSEKEAGKNSGVGFVNLDSKEVKQK